MRNVISLVVVASTVFYWANSAQAQCLSKSARAVEISQCKLGSLDDDELKACMAKLAPECKDQTCPPCNQWNGSRCVSLCKGGQVCKTGACICPDVQKWNGSQCATDDVPPECPKGTVLDAAKKTCVSVPPIPPVRMIFCTRKGEAVSVNQFSADACGCPEGLLEATVKGDKTPSCVCGKKIAANETPAVCCPKCAANVPPENPGNNNNLLTGLSGFSGLVLGFLIGFLIFRRKAGKANEAKTDDTTVPTSTPPDTSV